MTRKTAPPACPQCARPMVFVRGEPRLAGLSSLKTYRCQPCDVEYSETVHSALSNPERALMLNFQAECRPQ